MPKETSKKSKRLAKIIHTLRAMEIAVSDLHGRLEDATSDIADIYGEIESLREELQNE